MKYLVLDTNILLLDSSNLFVLSDHGKHTIVLPDTVIQEIDSKKNLMEEIGFHARKTSRLLSDAKLISVDKQEFRTVVTLEYLTGDYAVTLELVSNHTYKDDKNDLKIIEVAEDYMKAGLDTLFVSNDLNARFLALAKGIPVDYVREQADVSMGAIVELTVSPEVFTGLELQEAISVNPEHLQENYVYHIHSTDGNQALFLVHNGKLEAIDEDVVRKQEASPKNREQMAFSAAILSRNYDFIICDAKAGSGKSFCAISAAMLLVRQKKFSVIYYLRNTVHNLERNEEVGFLPGDEAAKFAPFFAPLFDTLRVMIRKHLASKKMKADDLEVLIEEKLEEMLKSYNIKPITTLGLRGRTLVDAIIIVDEVQNFSPSSAQTALTRIGENCMVIALGSSRQIDNAYLNKYTTGLAVLIGALKKEHDNVKLFGIELVKVVRGRLTEFAEALFSKS